MTVLHPSVRLNLLLSPYLYLMSRGSLTETRLEENHSTRVKLLSFVPCLELTARQEVGWEEPVSGRGLGWAGPLCSPEVPHRAPPSTAFWDAASTNELGLRHKGRRCGRHGLAGHSRPRPESAGGGAPCARGPWAVGRAGRPTWWTTMRCWACPAGPRLRPSRRHTASWRSSGTPTKTRGTRRRRRGGSNKWPRRTRCCQTPRQGTFMTDTARRE